MHLDVTALSDFYLTPLGRIVRQIIGAEMRAVWPTATAERLVGIGHATPYLRPYLGEAERVIALMPAAEGILHWPREGPNITALAYEDALPLPDSSVDKVLLVHVLETTHDPSQVLREAWRVLMPAGRILAIVPYRSGAWARAEHTPMGRGRPFSRSQLCQLLESAWLEPITIRRFLYVPPSRRRFVLGSAGAWERVGSKVMPSFAGMLAVEAQKTLMRGIPVNKPARGLKILVPGLAPVPTRSATADPLSGGSETRPAHQTGSRTTTAPETACACRRR
ncbi:class I SAM-dependent methyltransferase [Acuticoccus mangrovi]|uniref:Class I SAM-dependent methyltransferase n=1 Tax=Acuticoccus mangrovi TaxID=2796142 RepID=A0A934MIH1_9HYPH|nr:class I SAM-dependent methyltransferase [Acuticoccus mangrovi]MBJ3777191.1 class I SAM-dependent methyltransferase [Acuticoccus mangrovi]